MSTDPSGLAVGAERDFPVWGGPSERLRFLLRWALLARTGEIYSERTSTEILAMEHRNGILRLIC